MKQAAPAAQNLARRLLALEAGADNKLDVHTTSRAFEKLRLNLAKLVGVTGYQALISRALALAKAESVWLSAVEVGTNGTLVGFDENAHNQSAKEVTQGATDLLAQLLGLLITLIGEGLTLRLLQDIWSDLQWERNLGAEEILE